MGNTVCGTTDCEFQRHECVRSLGECHCGSISSCNLCNGSGLKIMRTSCGYCGRHCKYKSSDRETVAIDLGMTRQNLFLLTLQSSILRKERKTLQPSPPEPTPKHRP
eukprot:372344_1